MKTKKVIALVDTGRGQWRIAAGWQLYYGDDQDREGWTPPAMNAAYGRALDPYNRIDFTGVQTATLRLEVQLLDNFSGGLLNGSAQ